MPCEVFWVSRALSVVGQFHFKVWIARGATEKAMRKESLLEIWRETQIVSQQKGC